MASKILVMGKMQRLRQKRSRLAQEYQHALLRANYGEALASHIADAIRQTLSLENFDRSFAEPFAFDWPRDIRNASGLVAAYVAKADAVRILGCVGHQLGSLSGRVGYHDKPYLGYALVGSVDPVWLLSAAESAAESVVFYNEEPTGALMVDCYNGSHGEPFSIVAQGDALVEQVARCFSR